MGIETRPPELIVHLALFVAAGLAVGLAALALLERATGGGERRVIRWRYVLWAAGAFAALGVLELLYHAFLE